MNLLTPTFRVADADDDLVRLHFLRTHAAHAHDHVVRRELKRAVPRAALPARARNVRTVDLDHATHLYAEVDEAVVLVESWKTSARVTASAAEAAHALALVEEISNRVPRTCTSGKVEAAFTDQHGGSRYVELAARPWATVRDHYPDAVRDALDGLAAYTPDVDTSRRLLLWHGAPGTGKTTAIRALLDAWREWADGVVVTDPEALLNDGKYLRRTVLDHDDDERWQLIVLEDAEALLHKGSAGRGMATLLNLCDGLLGQGLRCLFLITTNEPLERVHPALVRAGRCLSRVEFAPLPAAHASRLLGRPVAVPMSLAEAFAVKPVSVEAAPVRVGQYL
jgi:hypothetical protein